MVNPESKYDILYIILFRIKRPFICSSLSYPQFQYIDSKVQTSTDFFLSLRTISHKMTIHKEEKKKCSSQFQNFIHRITLHPVGHNICKNPMKTLKIVGVTPLHWKSLKVVICMDKTMKFQFWTFDYKIVSNKFQTYRCFYLMDKNRRRRDTFECHFLFHVIWKKKM